MDEGSKLQGTILFAVVGRTQYGFDIYSVSTGKASISPTDSLAFSETKLTDGTSVNFNGSFCSDGKLVYISERTGSAKIYIKEENDDAAGTGPIKGTVGKKGHHCDLFYDRPTIADGKIFFVSTQEESSSLRQCWTAVYMTSLETGHTERLTPLDVADLSPSLSPSGKWMAVASYEGKGWQGEVEDLHTDIYIFNAETGKERRLLVKNGGWPTWADDRTIFFHRKADDGWWGIYKACISAEDDVVVESERLTPPCMHAFTPAASKAGEWLAVATRRPESKWRHIEIFHLGSGEFIEVTAQLHPEMHHYNPFVSAESNKIGYHRCRVVVSDRAAPLEDPAASLRNGNGNDTLQSDTSRIPRLEAIESPAGLPLIRVDGFFPSVSPCGKFIAYNRTLPEGNQQGLFVMRSDGSKSWRISNAALFYTAWDPCRKGVIYCTAGAIFAPASTAVQVAALHFSLDALTDDKDEVPSKLQVLTHPGTGNNAFAFPSPDGKQLVFRSGRGGGSSKNLYLMDAHHGEDMGVQQLTCGDWTDTMPSWSPDGQWIAFSSTMEGVNAGSFGLYMIHPDGTDLHRVQLGGPHEKGGHSNAKDGHDSRKGDDNNVKKAVHGRVNHVQFSPDGQSIVFTADAAALSAEPISLPNQFQPYGEIFVANLDGSNLCRLTHNAYEDGTPTWTCRRISLPKPKPVHGGPSFIASSGSEPLRGDFLEPLWLNRISEEMQKACC